jgi:hypothetical protein
MYVEQINSSNGEPRLRNKRIRVRMRATSASSLGTLDHVRRKHVDNNVYHVFYVYVREYLRHHNRLSIAR